MEGKRDARQECLIELESIIETIQAIPLNGGYTLHYLESLRIFPRASALPPSYDVEICRNICEHFGEHPSAGASYKEAIRELRAERLSKRREQKRQEKRGQEPTSETYFLLFKQILGPLPRDLFSGRCMVRIGDLWEPAVNHLDRVKSHAYDLNTEGLELRIAAIEPHFAAFEANQEAKFIPDVPQWDGLDRLKILADCCILDGSQQFPSNIVETYFKGWLSGVFRKLKDARYQNPVLILRSEKQGIGKDWLINTLTDGFGQWSRNLTLSRDDRDNYLQLSQAAVLKIGEFDRTSKTDAATLKDMIFCDKTDLRASYDRAALTRVCRASFVATVNPDDFYRDTTGNRRFAVFSLDRIDFSYPRTPADSQQILSQAKYLAETGYQIPPMCLGAMADFLANKTEEISEPLVEEWSKLVNNYLANCSIIIAEKITERGWITNEEGVDAGLFEQMARVASSNIRMVRQYLKSAGLGIRTRTERGYKWHKRSVTSQCHTR